MLHLICSQLLLFEVSALRMRRNWFNDNQITRDKNMNAAAQDVLILYDYDTHICVPNSLAKLNEQREHITVMMMMA